MSDEILGLLGGVAKGRMEMRPVGGSAGWVACLLAGRLDYCCCTSVAVPHGAEEVPGHACHGSSSDLKAVMKRLGWL